ncbi:MAG: GW dipeptide domain-containing protein [Balneolaceae bacterium]
MRELLFTFIFLFIFFSGTALSAQQARFDEATTLLEENQFREAVSLYKKIAREGNYSGSLWLNLGIAYSQLDSLGVSKYYFLRAKEYPETREKAENALSYVNERFSRQSAILPLLPWDRFFNFLSVTIGSGGLFISGFVFLYAGVFLIILSWFRHGFNRPLKLTGLIFSGITLLFFLTGYYLNYIDDRYGTGVLTDRQTTVFEQPREESAVISTAYEGYTMKVDIHQSKENAEWYYVRLENGMYGWVDRNSVMVF